MFGLPGKVKPTNEPAAWVDFVISSKIRVFGWTLPSLAQVCKISILTGPYRCPSG